MLAGDAGEVGDPARAAEDVDRQDRPGPVGHRLADEGRIDAQAVVLDIHEPRGGALVEDAVGRRDEAERRGDHLVAGADPERPDAEVQPGRAARAGDPLSSARQRRDAGLEPWGERAQGKDVAPQDLVDQLPLALADVGASERNLAMGGPRRVRHRSPLRWSDAAAVVSAAAGAGIRSARRSESISSMLSPSPA